MLRFTRRSGLSNLYLAGLVILSSVACQAKNSLPSQPVSLDSQSQAMSPAIPNSSSSSPAASPPPVPEPQVNTFELGLDKAASADSITKTAQSEEDWNLVVDQWLQAIDLMKRVPSSSPNRAMAKQKVVEYERQLVYAKQQAIRLSQAPNPTVPMTLPSPAASPSGPIRSVTQPNGVYRAKITRRAGNTPVIEVTFNGQHRFEMVVDTGASATVITQEMANILGVVPIDMATVDTASARDVQIPVGIAASIEAGGLISRNVSVMIAGPELDIGLLGHNFYGDYDITIKQDVVEFVPR